MALFNIGGPQKIHPLYEVPGKVYIFGQAHDISTLTPIFGDYLRGRNDPDVTGVTGSIGVEAIGLTDKAFSERMPASIPGAYVYPLHGEIGSFKTYTSMPIGDGEYISIGGGRRKICTATKYDADGVPVNSVTLACTSAAIVHEDELNLYCVGQSQSRPAGGGASIFSISKSNLAISVIKSATMGTTQNAGHLLSTAYPIHKDKDGVILITYEFTFTGSSGGSPASTQYAFNPYRSTHAYRISNGGIVTKTNTLVSLGSQHSQVSAAAIPNDGSFIQRLYETDTDVICGFFGYTTNSAASVPLTLIAVNKESLSISTIGTSEMAIPSTVSSVWVSQGSTATYRTHLLAHCIRETEDSVKLLLTSYCNLPSNSTSGNSGTSCTLSVTISKNETFDTVMDHAYFHRSNAGVTSVVSLNDSGDQFFVSYNYGGGDFLQLNPQTGEVIKKNSVEFPVFTGMVDQVGRFWVQDDSTGSIHLYGPSTSATLRVNFAETNLRYLGTPIITSLSVSAFNHMGDRVVNNVKLTLEGNSATFADGGNTTTISTSAAGDEQVAVRIVGNGFVRVAASLAV